METRSILVFIVLPCLVAALGCEELLPRDCQEVMDFGFTQPDVYNITPIGTYASLEVYCEMELRHEKTGLCHMRTKN